MTTKNPIPAAALREGIAVMVDMTEDAQKTLREVRYLAKNFPHAPHLIEEAVAEFEQKWGAL